MILSPKEFPLSAPYVIRRPRGLGRYLVNFVGLSAGGAVQYFGVTLRVEPGPWWVCRDRASPEPRVRVTKTRGITGLRGHTGS